MLKKIATISDTHMRHNEISFHPKDEGDVLLHTGDFSGHGTPEEFTNFIKWFSTRNFEYKILIAGNHDFIFERQKELAKEVCEGNGVIYLEDSFTIIGNTKIYGSPWQPRFFDWAFNLDRGEQIKRKWDLIPDDINVLLTHGPLYGILDEAHFGKARMGCEELLIAVKKINPSLHVFGHNHGGFGIKPDEGTTFINAASLTDAYIYRKTYVVVEYDFETNQVLTAQYRNDYAN